jgi:hypothetical protein
VARSSTSSIEGHGSCDSLQPWQLDELLGMADVGAPPMSEDMPERKMERRGDGLGDLFAEAYRVAPPSG